MKIKNIGTIENPYGNLKVTEYENKFYWCISGLEDDLKDLSYWEEIPEELYNALLSFNNLSKGKLNKMENIKDWYSSKFPTDDFAEEINPKATFKELGDNLPNVYDYLEVGDSIVRERCFSELADRMNVDYYVIYNKWLNGKFDHYLQKPK